MAFPPNPVWDWADSVLSALISVAVTIAGIAGWFTKKIAKLHKRIDDVRDTVQTQNAALQVQQAHHEANLLRLDNIEDMNKTQLRMLTELIQRK